MARFISLLASGISYGAILGLISLGFVVLYKATGVVNFAHGDMVTLGTYLAIWAITTIGMPVIVGYIVAILIMCVVGIVLERVAFAPLRKRPQVVVVLSTLAAALVIEGLIALWQGANPQSLPSLTGSRSWSIAGAYISYQQVIIVAVAAVAITGLLLVFRRTSFGRQVRALASDPTTARLYGVRHRLMSITVFSMSAGLAALAGVLVAPLSTVSLTFGFDLMIVSFAACVLGGFGNLEGIVAGSITVGIVQQLLGGYFLTNYSEVLPFVLLFAVAALRPQGLFTLRGGS